MFNQAVAVYFRELREGHGFTQEALAEAAGCGKRTIERIERNEGPVTIATLERLMTALAASPEQVRYLMTDPSATEQEAREFARALLQHDPAQPWTASYRTSSSDPSQSGIQAYVRTLRERQGLSRTALAERLEVPITTYADWEEGHSTIMAFPVLLRLTSYVGGTLDDLQRITLAPNDQELLGKRLAEERSAATYLHQHATSHLRDRKIDHASPVNLVHRLLVIEGLLHYVLSLLKRALPGDAAEIERTSAYWFQLVARDDETGGLS